MVIRFMALSQFLFTDFLPQFFICEADTLSGRWRLFLKDMAHMMQKPGNGLEQEIPANFFQDNVLDRSILLPLLMCKILCQISQSYRLPDNKVFDSGRRSGRSSL